MTTMELLNLKTQEEWKGGAVDKIIVYSEKMRNWNSLDDKFIGTTKSFCD